MPHLQLNLQRLLPTMPSPLAAPSAALWDSQRPALTRCIDAMFRNYHNADYSLLEDSIALNQQAQYLKRFYNEAQFAGKISMLSEYYQYHRELPRIFQQELGSTVSNYHEDVRNQEYQLVTRKLKDANLEQAALTERERMRPVDKIIRNIELSYYNFERKDIKRKEKAPTNKNKKSTPSLPLYQHIQKPQKHTKITVNAPPSLKPKDMNKLAIKSRSKEQQLMKKISLNNSADSPKNLSRSKSKSNLAMLHPEPNSKRSSVRAHQEPMPISKNKSNPVSLQKTSSSKNFLKRQDPAKKTLKGVESGVAGDKNGLKSMFKRAMQTKKLIKIAR